MVNLFKKMEAIQIMFLNTAERQLTRYFRDFFVGAIEGFFSVKKEVEIFLTKFEPLYFCQNGREKYLYLIFCRDECDSFGVGQKCCCTVMQLVISCSGGAPSLS